MQTSEIHEIHNINIPVSKTCPFGDSKVVLDPDLPVYRAAKGTYIWYKDSIPDDENSRVLSDEYDVLYQSVKVTEYKSKLKMYVSVYSACLTVVILFLLSTPFLPEALASIRGYKSPVLINDGIRTVTPTEQLSDIEQNFETAVAITYGSLGYTDMNNNVIYVLLPNGNYSIQESSWNTEEKAENRINKINQLDISYPDGTKVTAAIEKVDLFSKGVWYRTRVGEFATIKEAIETAVEFRALENS